MQNRKKPKDMKFNFEDKKDRLLYIDMQESLDQGNAHVVFDSENTLVLRENEWPLYYIASSDFEEVDKLLDEIIPKDGKPDDYPMLLPHGDELIEHVLEKTGYTGIEKCYQLLYDCDEPIKFETELDIRKPDPEDFYKIAETYHMVDEDVLKQDVADPHFFGGYIDGELACYAGMHSEGALGLLHVFEKFRGRGYAQQLEAHIINNHMKEGRRPYGHVFETNTASLELQKKMGLSRSEGKLAWVWKEEQ